MRQLRIIALLLAGLVTAADAQVPTQPPPDTEIFLAPLRLDAGWVRVGVPVNITNRLGYDNQPQFTRDGRSILYTAASGEGQSDIWRYDLGTKKSTQLTNTPESEYSPTPVRDGFTVIRVERDSTQRLWHFDARGRNPAVLFPQIKPVGYHAWITPTQAALFVLGSPPALELATGNMRPDTVATNIGRAIQKIPGWSGVSFAQRMPDSTLWIRRLNGATRAIAPIAKGLPDGEYHTWGPRGSLLGTAGSKLYEWSPINGGEWRETADFSGLGIRVSRIAVSPRGNWIAIVGERTR